MLQEAFGVESSETSVRRCIERNDSLHEIAEKRRVQQAVQEKEWAAGIRFTEDDKVEVTTPPLTEDISRLTIEQVMMRHDLDPDEWEAKRVLPNVWEANAGEGTKIPLYQFKVWFERKVPIEVIFPAFVGPSLPPPRPVDSLKVRPVLTVVVTDIQAPFRDDGLHELFLRWLAHNQPDQGVIGGDLLDNGAISRHRDDPAWHRTVQECIQSAFDTLYDYRQAETGTYWFLIKGNHDDRIRNEQLERSERLYGVTAAHFPGDYPEEWVYSLNHLLHLERLAMEYVEPKGTYEFEQVPLNELVAVRHGHKTVANAAMKTSEELGISVVLGHTHRQSVTRKTRWNAITGKYNILTAIEAGCMCKIEGGLGYANAGSPDWQPGFSTITTFPDGGFSFELATYENGVLRWRDQTYSSLGEK